jgi:hypothetical protein
MGSDRSVKMGRAALEIRSITVVGGAENGRSICSEAGPTAVEIRSITVVGGAENGLTGCIAAAAGRPGGMAAETGSGGALAGSASIGKTEGTIEGREDGGDGLPMD